MCVSPATIRDLKPWSSSPLTPFPLPLPIILIITCINVEWSVCINKIINNKKEKCIGINFTPLLTFGWAYYIALNNQKPSNLFQFVPPHHQPSLKTVLPDCGTSKMSHGFATIPSQTLKMRMKNLTRRRQECCTIIDQTIHPTYPPLLWGDLGWSVCYMSEPGFALRVQIWQSAMFLKGPHKITEIVFKSVSTVQELQDLFPHPK